MSLGKIKLKQIEHMSHPASKRVSSLISDPHKLLVTILVGNTLVNIAASSIFADFLYKLLGEKGIGFSIVLMTIILLICGEVTPKMFALSHAENFSFFVSLPLLFFERIFTPIRVVLTKIAYSLVKVVGLKIPSERPGITEQEIKSLVRIGKTKGIVKEKEKDMIDNILELKDLNAADIMTPRIEISALDINMDRKELIKSVKDKQYSRYPVYVHALDNIVGIIYAKDFLLNPAAEIKDIVKKPYFIPESKRADDLLQELQKMRLHMAIVTDEYGVTSGLVTIEDILEHIVGEIRDELDIEKPKVRKLDQKTFEINGQTHIDEVNEKLDLNIETDEVDTIGGYVILIMGKIPQAGDEIRLGEYIFKVMDVSNNRITSLTVEKTAPEKGTK